MSSGANYNTFSSIAHVTYNSCHFVSSTILKTEYAVKSPDGTIQTPDVKFALITSDIHAEGFQVSLGKDMRIGTISSKT